MTWRERITGSDLTRRAQQLQIRAEKLPKVYRAAWNRLQASTWVQGDWTGRSTMKVLERMMQQFEHSSRQGLDVQELVQSGIQQIDSTEDVVCENMTPYNWNKKLNDRIRKKLRWQMICEEKQRWKQMRTRVRRLPRDYRIVYREVERAYWCMGELSVEQLLAGMLRLIDAFEEGVQKRCTVLELTGSDPALFCEMYIKRAAE